MTHTDLMIPKNNSLNGQQNHCCSFAMEELMFQVLDGEANQQGTEQWKHHVEECVACATHFELEISIKEALLKIKPLKAPDELIKSIVKVKA